jgi:putative OPT family oligopeptide transporter
MPTSSPVLPNREFSARAVLLGSLLGILFGLVTVYIALEVGMNFSASIPIAVLAISVLKSFGRSSVLENNIVQTVGSAGESIAAGVVFTIPALLSLGYSLEIWQITFLGLAGGLLGIFFMIPLRHYLVVEQHGTLVYPEGTACAGVLVAGEEGGKRAGLVFQGLAVGLAAKWLMSGFQLWQSTLNWSFARWQGAGVSLDLSPELMGIGALAGLKVSRELFAGSLFASLMLVPLIFFFGRFTPAGIFPSVLPISRMTPDQVWSDYVRYIAAGAVIAGGVALCFRAVPAAFRSLRAQVRGADGRATEPAEPCQRDLPLRWVGLACFVTLAGLYVLLAWKINPRGPANLLAVVAIAIFGFIFVIVSARITGLMGCSANPISGLTIAVLVLICLIFRLVGWVGAANEIVAVSLGAVVCVAVANAGATAQDLKTGYLLGAAPYRQQVGLLVGVVTSVLLIGFTLTWLNQQGGPPYRMDPTPLPASSTLVGSGLTLQGQSYKMYAIPIGSELPPGRYLVSPEDGKIHFREPQRIGTRELPAPQAQVMAILVDGILNRRMQWRLLLAGISVALVLELCGISSLMFAVGMYLPASVTAAMTVGALIVRSGIRGELERARELLQPWVLYTSGLIAGGAIGAIALAIFSNTGSIGHWDVAKWLGWPFLRSTPWALLWYALLGWLLWRQRRTSAA